MLLHKSAPHPAEMLAKLMTQFATWRCILRTICALPAAQLYPAFTAIAAFAASKALARDQLQRRLAKRFLLSLLRPVQDNAVGLFSRIADYVAVTVVPLEQLKVWRNDGFRLQ